MALKEMFFEEDAPGYMLGHLLAGVGAVNWGLIAALNFNLVTALFGEGTMLTQAVYGLAGLGGLQVLGDLLVDLGVME